MFDLKAVLSNTLRRAQYSYFSSYKRKFDNDQSFTEAVSKYRDRNTIHAYMHHYLHHKADILIRGHRKYFSENMRGFGEDALHAMWWTILREFKPSIALEIGVYRGQVLTLWGLIAKLNNFNCEIHGISPFSPAGDQVSSYLAGLDYFNDTLESNQKFELPEPHLLKAFSTDEKAIEHLKSKQWDLIYIDGNHDYEIALSDYKFCRDALNKRGLLVMDDSSLYTDYRPKSFSFGGHPGPSRVVNDFAMKELRFLGGVGHNNVFQKL